jgi:hypothetical protein
MSKAAKHAGAHIVPSTMTGVVWLLTPWMTLVLEQPPRRQRLHVRVTAGFSVCAPQDARPERSRRARGYSSTGVAAPPDLAAC